MTLPISVVVTAITLAASLLVSCSTAPTTSSERDDLIRKAQAERQEWSKLDPGIEALAKRSHGVALFPKIAKAGWESVEPMAEAWSTSEVNTSGMRT
jgi:hypothetical protein